MGQASLGLAEPGFRAVDPVGHTLFQILEISKCFGWKEILGVSPNFRNSGSDTRCPTSTGRKVPQRGTKFLVRSLFERHLQNSDRCGDQLLEAPWYNNDVILVQILGGDYCLYLLFSSSAIQFCNRNCDRSL